ncbi:MAG: aminotransferase class V-fold PLP-dependent enzyme [Acidimicrobiaceae bacterium]|nr:aminotransferase class V-fold PLP-dependent enzyme [Acidimicrobiaceae bacterium]MYI52394.1 aminotransferase class V-fold PLP-dependent enzyme [Acidimicrobiaceae bacterium]MYJ42259.1 aminotransferase class V-fold PLP-dependent enzyme [Acidimicrobiaceae bacterium]
MTAVSAWVLEEGVLHLNHGSFGATPAAVLEAQQRLRSRMEANPTKYFLGGDYQCELDSARRAVADFVGADEAGLVFVNNVTAGVNAVLRSLEPALGSGDEILVTDHEYNACRNAAEVSASRTGARVTTVQVPFPIESSQQAADTVLAAVTDRTRILLIDAVTSATGLVMPVAEIAAEIEPDVRVLVDAAHAPGMINFDVAALGASYVTANCHKWMCSAKGAGFLWVRADRRDDVYHSVISHGYNGGWPSGGGRLHAQFDWTGTDDPSAWLTVPDALDAVGAMHPDGWPGVRQAIRDLCLSGRRILLDALGIDPPAPDDMIGAIASVPVPPAGHSGTEIFDPLMAALEQRHRIQVPVFIWPAPPERLLRISAHLYNDESQYRRLAEAVTAELHA